MSVSYGFDLLNFKVCLPVDCRLKKMMSRKSMAGVMWITMHQRIRLVGGSELDISTWLFIKKVFAPQIYDTNCRQEQHGAHCQVNKFFLVFWCVLWFLWEIILGWRGNSFLIGLEHSSILFEVYNWWHRLWFTWWSKKTDSLCFLRLNFIKYWPIFKLISLSESAEHL